MLGDERREGRVVEVLLPLVGRVLERRRRQRREDRRASLVLGQRHLEPPEDRDVATLRPADHDPGRWPHRLARPRRLTDAVAVLLTEPDPEPGVDQRRDRSPGPPRSGSSPRPRPSARPANPYRSRTTSGSATAWPAPSTQMFGPHSGSPRCPQHVADDGAVADRRPRPTRPPSRRSPRSRPASWPAASYAASSPGSTRRCARWRSASRRAASSTTSRVNGRSSSDAAPWHVRPREPSNQTPARITRRTRSSSSSSHEVGSLADGDPATVRDTQERERVPARGGHRGRQRDAESRPGSGRPYRAR